MRITIAKPDLSTIWMGRASMLLASSLLFYPALQSLANVPQHTVQQQAGGYRVQVGKILVTSFTDEYWLIQDLGNYYAWVPITYTNRTASGTK